jgi:hypothetical protein
MLCYVKDQVLIFKYFFKNNRKEFCNFFRNFRNLLKRDENCSFNNRHIPSLTPLTIITQKYLPLCLQDVTKNIFAIQKQSH